MSMYQKTNRIITMANVCLIAVLPFFLLLSFPAHLAAQTTEDCMMCHEDPELVRDRNNTSVFVDLEKIQNSVHSDLDCIFCHQDLDGFEDWPHEENLEPVACDMCHDDIAAIYEESLHGQAVKAGEELAPRCWDCHTGHNVLPRQPQVAGG